MSQISTPSIDRLKRAVEVAEQIEKLQSELASILGDQHAVPAAPVAKIAQVAKVAKVAASKPAGKGKRTMSPEARERIAAAQRARWAKSRGSAVAKPAASAAAPKAKAGKRSLSPEAREKIAAAARRRWAAFKKK
jgi:glucan-binding YG repeat protein